MSRKKVKTGDIIQTILPKNLGFAYGKYINLPEINPDCRYPSLLRIFNFRTSDSNIDIKELEKCDLLLSPLLIAGIEASIKEGVWKIIGNISLREDEKVIPNYKLNEDRWFYVIDADKFTKKIESKLENVKHLEVLSATGASLLPTKIAMAFLRDEGKKIEDYFELKEYFEKVYYEEVMAIPAYYKQSNQMKGKAQTS